MLGVLLGALCVPGGALGAPDPGLLVALARWREALGRLEGRFEAVAPDGRADDGSFVLARPGRARIEWRRRPVLTVADGTWLATWNRRTNTLDRRLLRRIALGAVLGDAPPDRLVGGLERIPGRLVAAGAGPAAGWRAAFALSPLSLVRVEGGGWRIALREVREGRFVPPDRFAIRPEWGEGRFTAEGMDRG